MNKDNIKAFKELITRQKEGNDIEFQNIKNELEIGLKKFKDKYDILNKKVDEQITGMRGDKNENKAKVENIDGTVKENLKVIGEFKIKGDQNIIDFSNKIKQIEEDSMKKYEEAKINISKELDDKIKKEVEKREKFEKDVNDKITSKLHSYDNNISDLKEKSNQLKKMIEDKYNNEVKDKNAIGINNLKFDEIYSNKFNNLNKDIQENNKKIKEDIEKKINLIKTYVKKNMDEYSVHVDNDLYQKFNVLSNDFKEKIDKIKLELDGKIQQYFVEFGLKT